MSHGVADRAVAIVGVGAVFPDAPDASTFWENIVGGRCSITDVGDDYWDPALYFDEDHSVPAKSYSRIGGWCRNWRWDPREWRLPIPPRVSNAMDRGQKWSVSAAREALLDYGYPEKPLDQDRVGVILGNAMGGDLHYVTSLRIQSAEVTDALSRAPAFKALPADKQRTLIDDVMAGIAGRLPDITEDTMPGELSNIVASRIAALFDLHGPAYTADAACASTMAAMTAAISGLVDGDYDAVLTGGIDSNMSPTSFVKFSKIGALSAIGSFPYSDRADGFVMGEGGALFLLKRLADAERDGDRIYAVIRAIGASSDGKGKGITAPNPKGQMMAVQRAWELAGVSPATVSLIEGHGTSTKVGDVVEVECLNGIFGAHGRAVASIPLGSVKSNIGHLKSAAAAAGVLKAALALHHKQLPPSLGYERPNPGIDFSRSPFYVNTQLRPWTDAPDGVRRAGVSSFGFGGTNFHVVLEEYVPGRIQEEQRKSRPVTISPTAPAPRAPLRGAVVLGAADHDALAQRVEKLLADSSRGAAPALQPPLASDLAANVRLAFDYEDSAELAGLAKAALAALRAGDPARWKVLAAKGVFLGEGKPGKVAFLYPGQGSQYVNMLRALGDAEPLIAQTFADADRVMTPILGRPLTDYIFIDTLDEEAVAKAAYDLKQTEITQPAVLAADLALQRLLGAYGIEPDMVMGHSLGEYGAMMAAGAMDFGDALEAVSARGSEMARVQVDDRGMMAAVVGPLDQVEKVIDSIEDYVVVANINSPNQAVIGGSSPGVTAAIAACTEIGMRTVQLEVSHAFHTAIVAPASEPLGEVLKRLDVRGPKLPVISNVLGTFYPMGPDVRPQVLDLLSRQVAAPVQFIKGLNSLYEAGARVFVEVGPKRALGGFVLDVLGAHGDVVSITTNHPKMGDVVSFNRALCGLWAAGLGVGRPEARKEEPAAVSLPAPVAVAPVPGPAPAQAAPTADPRILQLGQLFADFLERGRAIYEGAPQPTSGATVGRPVIVISGAALGLPGTERVFDDANIGRLLRGDQFIQPIPEPLRARMLDKNITRLVKGDHGVGFETIDQPEQVIKLAGRKGHFDLVEEFGFPAERDAALDITTRLAIGAGIDALRDAGIPLVLHLKTTSTGKQLPDRWMLPESMRDDTGIIFASAFPGLDFAVGEMDQQRRYVERKQRIEQLRQLRATVVGAHGAGSPVAADIDARIRAAEDESERDAYVFERRFLFRALAMGHSQFAEYIGARGPNTQVNTACASTTQAVALAEDWMTIGRCRRVIVIAADDVTSDNLLGWIGSGFLASGAAATDSRVEDAALPFDRRRHGMLIGMGAAAMVVETEASAAERAVAPICQVMGTVTANSAFHGTRLDVNHIASVMEQLVAGVEQRWGLDRQALAHQMVFISHETYTPARGGSASAEVNSLRRVFGAAADNIVIANTKGFTGHPMGVGIEDAMAVKILETGMVPPVANIKETDPDLGYLNLSRGGQYPVRYALRLAAGFGSQISMTLLRWVPSPDGQHRDPAHLGYQPRIVDNGRRKAWLVQVGGSPDAAVEVVCRTLRIRSKGMVPVVTAPAPVATTPAPVVVAPVQVAPPTQGPAAEVDPVTVALLEIVAEKTGYPAEMLELDLDLEADLGIDTVKQAEMLAAVRERWDIPASDDIQLRDFPTLQHVVGFVYDHRPDLERTAVSVAAPSAASAPVVAPVPTAGQPTAGGVDPVVVELMAIVAEKTGYPTDMLELDLDLEADLGIDTVKQAEMFAAIRERYDIPANDDIQLRNYPTLGHVVAFVREHRPDLAAAPVVVVAPATPAVTMPSAAPVASGADPVAEVLMGIVAEKTGYPTDMLELDLDLEADLGIDTVKQAEMFAAIRERYDIPSSDDIQLRDYPTLSHVVAFVRLHRPDLAPAPAAPVVAAVAAPAAPASATPAARGAAPAPAATGDDVAATLLAIVAEKTGYPEDMLELDLDLEADLGIDTVKQAEMFAAIRERYDIPSNDDIQLRDYPTLNHVIGFVRAHRPDLAPAVAVASAPAEAAPAPTAADEGVATVLLAIVAEKTGYPQDMLEMDLDLEADLGIDTVKQAEMFAAIRERYGIAGSDDIQLRDYPTLNHVVAFVESRRPRTATPSVVAVGPDATAPGVQASRALVPRRVPVCVPRPLIEACKGTGVELGKGSRVVVGADEGGVAKALVKALKKRGVECLVVDDAPAADELAARLDAWRAEGPLQGLFWLPALDDEGPLALLSPDAFAEAVRVRVRLLYTALRNMYEDLDQPGSLLVSGTRLGGFHGYDAAGATAPLGGPVVGVTKTLKRERPTAHVKAVDVALGVKPAQVAQVLIEEALHDNGAVEIGRSGDLRCTVVLRELDAEPSDRALGSDAVFMVTGGAGSITSAIVSDLARHSGGTFWLLDLAPEPDRGDPDLQRVQSDPEGLKRDLFNRLKERGERATPALVGREMAGLERKRAALDAILAVEAAGGRAVYRSFDLRDPDAVARVVAEVRDTHGKVDVLVHAAGLEISRMLPDKQPSEFDLVFDVKAVGWHNLLRAIGDTPLGAAVVFSSIAGRFGNAGQADYSAANDLLCKSVSSFRRERPGTRGVAVDWTAWGGIGMATRGSIPKMMEVAGIDMLPPEEGIVVVRRELLAAGSGGEILVGQRLGLLTEEWDADGGLDSRPRGPMVQQVRAGLFRPLVATATLDPTVQPFLDHHRIDGTPVLPGVMGVEAMAEAALAPFPGWHVATMEGVVFDAPFKFYRDQPREVKVEVEYELDGGGVIARCRLVGERPIRGKAEPQVTTHFVATARLSPGPAPTRSAEAPGEARGTSVGADDLYKVYFHGPAYQVLDRAWMAEGTVIGRFADDLPPNYTGDGQTVCAPRLVELCFQTAGVWEMGTAGRMGLPRNIGTLRRFADPTEAGGRLHAVVTPRGEGFDAAVVDEGGNVYVTLDSYGTIELPGSLDAELLAPLEAVTSTSAG